MTEPMSVTKYEYALPGDPVGPEQDALDRAIRDVGNRAVANMSRWMNATPEERAQWAAEGRQREAEVQAGRAAEREAAPRVPLTLDALLARVDDWGWSREYVEHLVQPYCGCEDGRDGWEYCSHARDLGFAS